MTIFHEFAPAKVNLTLKVLGRRPDGYHELQSLVAFARDVSDELTLDTSHSSAVTMSGPFAATLSGVNLIDVALTRISTAAPQLHVGTIHAVKNLPVAAGIGGGSADAAAVLRAVRRANKNSDAEIDWQSLAIALGADVPVCFANRAAWMTGIGDVVHQCADLPLLYAVLVNPLQPMPADKTAQVFRTLNAPKLTASSTVAPMTAAHTASPPTGSFASAQLLLKFMKETGNHLEPASLKVSPVIAEIKSALTQTPGCLYAAVSGGGPTCFAIFEDAGTASSAASTLSSAHPTWWIKHSRLN